MSTPHYNRVAVLGGVYSNSIALERAIDDAKSRGAEALICLGDLGAFGPHPDKAAALLRSENIPVVRGNYDDSIARGLADCQCGYTDPQDNYFARISYQYTFQNTSQVHREWMAGFPEEIRFRLGELDVLACHGSPRQTNEFLWESSTPTHFLAKLGRDHAADVILGTHTGIHWKRQWDEAGWYVNVGALGRPANDGSTSVWYAMVEATGKKLKTDFIPVQYDHRALAADMRSEGLPEQFVETVLTGWWTTCLEILPSKERRAGRF